MLISQALSNEEKGMLSRAMWSVFDQIAPDLDSDCESLMDDPDFVVEMATDANRLLTFGYPEAEELKNEILNCSDSFKDFRKSMVEVLQF